MDLALVQQCYRSLSFSRQKGHLHQELLGDARTTKRSSLKERKMLAKRVSPSRYNMAPSTYNEHFGLPPLKVDLLSTQPGYEENICYYK